MIELEVYLRRLLWEECIVDVSNEGKESRVRVLTGARWGVLWMSISFKCKISGLETVKSLSY